METLPANQPLPPSLGPAWPERALAPPPPDAADLAGIDWPRVASAVVRFKWLIGLAALVGLAAGVAATRFLRPDYLAQATVWIDETGRGGGDRGPMPGPIRPAQLLDPEAWVDLLRSYTVLDQVVRDQRLFLELHAPADSGALAGLGLSEQFRPGTYRLSVDPTGQGYMLTTRDGVELERGTLGGAVGARLGFRWTPGAALPAGRTIEFTVVTPRDAARRLGEKLEIQMDPAGNFLSVALRGPSAERITAIVNAVTQRYVQVAAELKRERLTELTKILDEQLQAAQHNLRTTEAALEDFRVRTITLPGDRAPAAGAGVEPGRDPVFSSFYENQLERDQLRRDREALEQLLLQAGDSGLSADALSVIGAVQRSAELTQALKELMEKEANLRALRYRYADAYPPVQKLAEDIRTLERQTLPLLVRALVAKLAQRETELGRQVDAESHSLRAIPPRTVEEGRLRRAVALAENLYTTLQQRYDEAHLAEASTVPDVRILDSAVVPQRPVKNRAGQIMALALLASVGCAMLGAVVLDRVDPRVRYPEQVSREMGLPILGAVPHLQPEASGGQPGGGPAGAHIAEVVEALRGVCLNLVYAHGTAGPLLVTVTSPGGGDGKSFLTSNLARTFAHGGYRVLLIDGDIRRGVLHRRVRARRRPGLTEYLRGEVPLEAIIQATPFPGFALIGCGTRVQNAPELLGSPAMGQLISRVRASYDVILLDSPPLGAGVDPLILGTLTGSLVLVLRTGYSHRDVAAAKLEVLQRLPIRVLGAILNDMTRGAAYRYYSYYLPGYEAVDETSGDRPSGDRVGVTSGQPLLT
ncbi:MAG TPA: polysaccharide biosynthesis tyrosine autokinase [Gemmatimonadales bacterium]|nr:polysaccharide biosynthesis tyrosine autokinase [Gemmatimonadales bacterium]